ncbi:MAG: DUF1028 domain-containing protein [Gemmatimonadota bacterium]
MARVAPSRRASRPVRSIVWRSGLIALALAAAPYGADAQEPASWGNELLFHTFSIAAVDPATGESGVAVTTRVACVGNGVPWVRAGVGAVATQASTRTEYGAELLDFMEEGLSPTEALTRATEADDGRERRQVGVVSVDGRAAQHTGSQPGAWAGHRSGPNYAAQGNVLVGPEVVEAVADAFEASEGSERHLADRLIEALMAGQVVGGDRRVGRLQSASVIVVDPREGMARRPDGQTVHINVCEHQTPVAELRRVYDTVSQTLGFRELSQPSGNDVWQLKLMLHALGRFGDADTPLERNRTSGFFNDEVASAVDEFRIVKGLSNPLQGGTPPGFVDAALIEMMWIDLEAAGKATALRAQIRELTRVRR